MKNFITITIGFGFGTILLSTQAVSWFRIQQMFQFKSFHMYGVLISAITVASFCILLIKKLNIKSIYGNPIILNKKKLDWKANIIGGLLFGIGWGLTGACSAPIYILVGHHFEIGLPTLFGAITGVYIFGKYTK